MKKVVILYQKSNIDNENITTKLDDNIALNIDEIDNNSNNNTSNDDSTNPFELLVMEQFIKPFKKKVLHYHSKILEKQKNISNYKIS